MQPTRSGTSFSSPHIAKRTRTRVHEEQEDAWINDIMPTPEQVASNNIQDAIASLFSLNASTEHIERGHPLWPLVLHLSEHIWQEVYQQLKTAPISEAVLAEIAQKRALELLRADVTLARQVRNSEEMAYLLCTVVDDVLGCGPLEPLLKDDSVTEIVAIGPRKVYVERNGVVEEAACSFEDERHMQRIIENILRRSGSVSGSNNWPLKNVRLAENTRVNIVMPPSAASGPTMTIHKSVDDMLSLDDLVQYGTLTQQMADFLSACVVGRMNIVICGSRGSGRTTLLNALAGYIPAEERIVTLELTPELELHQKQVISLLAQTNGPKREEQVTLRDLVSNALHMNPERILLGECYGDEFVELLQAMYTGYNGTMMTMYAGNVRDCLARLETRCLAGGMLVPIPVIRTQLAHTLNVIVHISRLPDGSRKILNIAEIQSVEGEIIKAQGIFRYVSAGLDGAKGKVTGAFAPCGTSPRLLSQLEMMDIFLPQEIFMAKPAERQPVERQPVERPPVDLEFITQKLTHRGSSLTGR